MKRIIKTIAPVILIFCAISTMSFFIPAHAPSATTSYFIKPKIQAAILLDVSGSMNGLIEQAKAQLWNMVSVMGRAKCINGEPQIEIALYEYGRPINDKARGYVKKLSDFTTDLDELSKQLFSLQTAGGDEYCGQVIYTSLDELKWDPSPGTYKVIFIAGNEDFLQGSVHYKIACNKSKDKGVIVNTIYCGNREQGIREHWNLGGECGDGSYTNIDHNAKAEEIPTPYDSTLFVLNQELNGTYVYYGAAGEGKYADQAKVDQDYNYFSSNAAAKRISVKGKKSLYNNTSWDLVDAVAKDKSIIDKVDMKTLPKSMQNKSRADLKKIVDEKTAKRELIRKKITETNTSREAYVAKEKAKKASKSATLETEVEKIIKVQAKRFKMEIE